jgi:hypothetical protein
MENEILIFKTKYLNNFYITNNRKVEQIAQLLLLCFSKNKNRFKEPLESWKYLENFVCK